MTDSTAGDLRARITERFGPWNEAWAHALESRPEYLHATLMLDGVAERSNHLHPRARAFVRLSLNASVTHLNAVEARRAIADAFDAGASVDEIFEVLVVASTLGVHGMNADVLAEVLRERGEDDAAHELDERQISIRTEYTAVRGYWRDFLNDTLELAPDFLEAYLEFSAAPWRHGVLEAKVREFLYLAFDTSPTHLHMTGLRIHMHNALEHGATPGEIVEVMSLAAAMGLQTLRLGAALLGDEIVSRSA